MAANDEFPRGWTLISAPAAGNIATITVPAAAGIVRVLDGFDALTFNGSGSATAIGINLTSSDGVYNAYQIGMVVAATASSGLDSATGLNLATGPGSNLTVAWGTGLASSLEYLRIRGHDI